MRYSLEIESDDRAYNGSTYKSLYNKRTEIIERKKQHSKKLSSKYESANRFDGSNV